MGSIDLELIILVGLTISVVGVVFLRTHAALMIMATCVGFVLSNLWSQTLIDALLGFTDFFDSPVGESVVSMTLFLLPPILIGFHFKKSQTHRIVQQAVPAVFWVAFTAAMSISFLPEAVQETLKGESRLVFFASEFLDILALVAILVALVEFMSEHTGGLIPKRRGRPPKH